MSDWIFMNGTYVHRENAKVSVFDRGYLFGDGVFEGIRAYNGNVFKLKEHIERLFDSAHSLLLSIPYTHDEIKNIVIETLKKNRLDTAYIRIIVSRGVGDRYNLDPFVCMSPQLIVITEKFEAFSSEFYENGVEVLTVPTRRNRADTLSPQVKSLNYLNNILVKIEAKLAGMQDGLILNTEGYVAESTTQNLFIYKNEKLITPPCSQGALEGITRNTVIDLATEYGYNVEEELITRHDVYTAEEVFMTGTAAEIISVVKVDGRVIGIGKPGKLAIKLFENFKKYVVIEGEKIE
ncbi:branched-chain-amino-acid transaminase [Chengkuizengella sediminis]|uniref:branched-chain-amino-acid transaminase n=1 Tax=Chengkuizengella sediminis TaxID=1885917 RepID=UPI00138A5D09|nr:branched-chain-amino-acid transaminase [Chengkuizengella sediminis]NDI34041.1 branched-chain-amino-acid transaminase [Chengkuizengella sediminis]